MSIDATIEDVLLTRLEAFAGSQSMNLAKPNVAFDPPTPVIYSTKYLRATFVPVLTETMRVADGEDMHIGFLQADVFHGQGRGELVPRRIADALCSYFPYNLSLFSGTVRVDISAKPFTAQALFDNPWVIVPVRIPYRCFA